LRNQSSKPSGVHESVPHFILTIKQFYNKNKTSMKKVILSLLLSVSAFVGFGQVTTSSISGVVKNEKNEVLVGATIQAVHTPTGTKYAASTNKTGAYVLPAVRVGGPYTIQATYVGYSKDEVMDVSAQLGVTSNVNFLLVNATTTLSEVVVVSGRNNIISKERTGASQQFSRR
jgi:amino acid transporter